MGCIIINGRIDETIQHEIEVWMRINSSDIKSIQETSEAINMHTYRNTYTWFTQENEETHKFEGVGHVLRNDSVNFIDCVE